MYFCVVTDHNKCRCYVGFDDIRDITITDNNTQNIMVGDYCVIGFRTVNNKTVCDYMLLDKDCYDDKKFIESCLEKYM
jgi:hypothetical protein